MLSPYMPTVSQTIRDQLNAPQSCINTMLQGTGTFVCALSAGHRIGTVSTASQMHTHNAYMCRHKPVELPFKFTPGDTMRMQQSVSVSVLWRTLSLRALTHTLKNNSLDGVSRPLALAQHVSLRTLVPSGLIVVTFVCCMVMQQLPTPLAIPKSIVTEVSRQGAAGCTSISYPAYTLIMCTQLLWQQTHTSSSFKNDRGPADLWYIVTYSFE